MLAAACHGIILWLVESTAGRSRDSCSVVGGEIEGEIGGEFEMQARVIDLLELLRSHSYKPK